MTGPTRTTIFEGQEQGSVSTFKSNVLQGAVFLAVTGPTPAADDLDTPFESVLLSADDARTLGLALVTMAAELDAEVAR